MLNRLIRYRGIIHERTEDAPFMGALIIAEKCSNNCQGCFNQHLKNGKVFTKPVYDIIQEVSRDVFNEGIILGGLEWSEAPEDTMSLIEWAKMANLQVILYTGLTEGALFKRIPEEALRGCYVKFGMYDKTLRSRVHVSYGVQLASTNQYIKYFRG